MKLKKGEYVKVYQKPMSHEDYEGIGKVVKVQEGSIPGELIAEVSFRDDRGPFVRILCEPIEIVSPDCVPAGIEGDFGGF